MPNGKQQVCGDFAQSKFWPATVELLPRGWLGCWICNLRSNDFEGLVSVSASPCPERLISLGCFRPQSPLLHGTDPIAFLDRCEQKAAIWSVACPQAANQEVPSANRGPFVVWVLVLTSERYRVRAALTVSRATVPALQDG